MLNLCACSLQALHLAMPSDGSARMMPTEEPTLPPGVVIRQVQVEDGSRFTEVRKGTQTYR